jgi:ferredoxin
MTETSKEKKEKHILFCKCGGERINPDLLNAVNEHLKNQPVPVTCLSDLCGLVQQKKELLSDLFSDDAEYLIIGCYSRTMNLLFGQFYENFGKLDVHNHVNLIEMQHDQVIERINSFSAGYAGNSGYNEIIEDSGWPSWYPVLDYSRCTACGQCADFCLFGVYEKTEDHVDVTNPQGCKNNCPACARICPSSAIIFPKYKNGGAVGGSDEIDEFAEQQRQALDLENFLGTDIYSALEKRKLKRKSIIRDESMKTALTERDNAVKGILK